MADVGIKFGVEGNAEFKKAIADINRNLKVLGSEMKAVSSEYDKNDRSVEALTAKNKVLNKEIDEQKNKVKTLESALKNSVDTYGENSKETQQWTVKLNEAKAKLNNLEREVKQNEDAMNGLGDEVKQTGNDMDDAGRKATSFGDILKGTLASDLIMSGLRAIVNGVKELGQGIVGCATNAASFADNILTLSAQTSVSTGKLQEMQYAAELVDVSTETITNSMAKNIKSMSSASDGSKDYVDAYKQLGVAVTDSNGKLRDSEDVYWESIDALGKVSSETERDALAMQLFGKSAQDLNPMIEAGSGKMKEFAEQAHQAGYVMSDEALSAAGAFDDQIQYLKVNSEAAKNTIGGMLMPALTTLATAGNDMLKEFTSGLSGANGDVGKIGDVINKILGEIISKVNEYLPKIIEVGTQLLGALSIGIISNLPQLVQCAVDVVTSLANGVSANLPILIPAVVKAILQIAEVLTDPANLGNIIQAAIQIITALAEGLIDALPVLIQEAPEIILQLLTALITAAPQLLAAGVEMVGGIVNGLTQSWDKIKQAGKDVISNLWEGIKERWEDVKAWFVTAWDNLFGNKSIDVNGYSGGGTGGGVGLSIKSNAVGLDYVPYDNYLSYLHKGEMIVPADVADGLRGAINLPTQSGVKIGMSGYQGAATVNHTGTIRVEGVNSSGEMQSVVDIVMDSLRRECRV